MSTWGRTAEEVGCYKYICWYTVLLFPIHLNPKAELQNEVQWVTGKHRCKTLNRAIERSFLPSLLLEFYLDRHFCRVPSRFLITWPNDKYYDKGTLLSGSGFGLGIPFLLTALQDVIMLDWYVGLCATKSALILLLFIFFYSSKSVSFLFQCM